MSNTPTNSDSLPLELIVRRAQQAEQEVREAQAALAGAQGGLKAWSDLREAVRTRYYGRIVQILTEDAAFFSALRRANDPAIPDLERLYRYSLGQLENLSQNFAHLFEEACSSCGVALDSGSRHPKYSIAGFIQLQVDDRKKAAQLSTRDGPTVELALDPAVVANELKRNCSRLFERPLDAKKFLAGLRRAYRAVLKEEKRKLGDEVPLRRVANRLGKNWKSLAMDEFNVDLARVLKSGDLVVEGERMHLNHTRDTRMGMLLHGFESGGYVGFISFKKEGTDA